MADCDGNTPRPCPTCREAGERQIVAGGGVCGGQISEQTRRLLTPAIGKANMAKIKTVGDVDRFFDSFQKNYPAFGRPDRLRY
jgi:hypothetical protein